MICQYTDRWYVGIRRGDTLVYIEVIRQDRQRWYISTHRGGLSYRQRLYISTGRGYMLQGVPQNLTHYFFGLLWIVRLSNFPIIPSILKLMYWGQKLVLIVFWGTDITYSCSKLFKIKRKDLYQVFVLLGECLFKC